MLYAIKLNRRQKAYHIGGKVYATFTEQVKSGGGSHNCKGWAEAIQDLGGELLLLGVPPEASDDVCYQLEKEIANINRRSPDSFRMELIIARESEVKNFRVLTH